MGGGQKESENFVTGEEGFVCWILEIVTISINSSYVHHEMWALAKPEYGSVSTGIQTGKNTKTLLKRGN